MKKLMIFILMLCIPLSGFAFESGSSGANGELNITEDTELLIPPSGIFNFTDVTIALGATLTFTKNANNTPVTVLATGDVTINGNIRVDGSNGVEVINNVPQVTDGNPGKGGAGGFDGGTGGLKMSTGANEGGNGLGPGGGFGGPRCTSCTGGRSGGGASYGSLGSSGNGSRGVTYGNGELLPLIGGSGGGGGGGGSTFRGSGGGGGGGAILIAASGSIVVNGLISANSGRGGDRPDGGGGGSGSGGAIRLIATTIQGQGNLEAFSPASVIFAGNGGGGRIRIEAENFVSPEPNSIPDFSFSTPNPVFISNLPSIRISIIGGITVPATPTGFRDVELGGVTTNPVTVEFVTENVPLGTNISLSATPERGTAVNASSTPVAGSLAAGTASADINLPNGNSTLFAQTTFTVTASLGMDFSKYAQGEQVEKIKVAITAKGLSETTFITVSGKEFTWPSNTVAMN